MPVHRDTVKGRIDQARIDLSPAQLAAILAVAAGVGFLLMFVQDPLVHDSLHNFRHLTGITCN